MTKNMKKLKEGTYILHSLYKDLSIDLIQYTPTDNKEPLSCGICDKCTVPIMKNSGDGINEPLDPYLYCPKLNIEISPSPKDEQLKECEFFEADRGITITKNYEV